MHDLIMSYCTESDKEHQESKYEEFQVFYYNPCLAMELLKDALTPQVPQTARVVQPEVFYGFVEYHAAHYSVGGLIATTLM